ncbi:MAG: MBL fold metallo-hydrolase [Woeseiaceae bacterium]
MILRNVSLSVLAVMFAACAEQPVSVEQQFVEDVTAALGGRNAIEAVETLTMEAEGRMLNIGQDLTPEAATMEFDITDYKLTADLANNRSRTELTRTPLFDYFRGRDPMPQVNGIDGNVAYDIGADGSARRAHEDVATDRRSSYYHHPLPLLRAALLNMATVGNIRDEGGNTLADVTLDSGKVFTLAIDSASKLPTYIGSTDHHYYLRDIVRQTEFSEYIAVGDVMLPSVISQSFDEFHVFRIQVTAQSVNDPVTGASAPQDVIAATPVTGSSPAQVTAEQLADGVWVLAGQSHHSVLFEFSDHLKLLEAPNEVRTLAVIAKAKELVPGKPLTHMINTHHHFDHSGGIRTAVSAGLTVITQAANEAFYRRMAEQPSTLVPDTLSRAPRGIEIEVVDEKATYADDAMTVELYHVAGSQHSNSIMMAYLPEQRVLIEADLYNPGRTTPQLFAPNLLDNIQNYGLEVERIVPIHGGTIDFEELESAVHVLRN